jgi:hypothetical protein
MTNKEMLNEITAYAALAFSPVQIACILQLDVTEFIENYKDPFNDYGRAYLAGKLKTEAEVRKAIFTLSKQGSGPAQILALKYIKKQEIEELKS